MFECIVLQSGIEDHILTVPLKEAIKPVWQKERNVGKFIKLIKVVQFLAYFCLVYINLAGDRSLLWIRVKVSATIKD